MEIQPLDTVPAVSRQRIFRIDPALDARVQRAAKRDGITVSELIRVLLTKYAQKEISLCTNTYPPEYLRALEREADAAVRNGKGYGTVEELIAALRS